MAEEEEKSQVQWSLEEGGEKEVAVAAAVIRHGRRRRKKPSGKMGSETYSRYILQYKRMRKAKYYNNIARNTSDLSLKG